MPASTIHNVLRRHGLIVPKASHRPALQRFERSAPNQLWQMDFKGDYPVDGGRCYPLTMLAVILRASSRCRASRPIW